MTSDQAKQARRSARKAVEHLGKDVADAVSSALQYLADLSYPRRLLELAEYGEPAVPGVTGRTSEWKKSVAEARNDFAHKLDRGFLDEATSNRYLAVLLSVRWLLTGVPLRQTGINPATLSARIASHEPYQLFQAQARTWLPGIFQPTPEPTT